LYSINILLIEAFILKKSTRALLRNLVQPIPLSTAFTTWTTRATKTWLSSKTCHLRTRLNRGPRNRSRWSTSI